MVFSTGSYMFAIDATMADTNATTYIKQLYVCNRCNNGRHMQQHTLSSYMCAIDETMQDTDVATYIKQLYVCNRCNNGRH